MLLAACALAAGCQSPGHSPYQYRFGRADAPRLCLISEPAEADSLSLQVRNALEEAGFSVRVVTDFKEAACTECVHFKAELGDWSGSRIKRAVMVYSRVTAAGVETVQTQRTPDDIGSAFGAPIDGEMVLIRSMVGQLFPDPIPWTE